MPPLDTVIHYYKYRRFRTLAGLLGRAMANIIEHDLILKRADYLVPVPLFWWKRLRRGFNQAQVLADVIGRECRIPVGDCLVRVKSTRTQTRLVENKRRLNVRGAFALRNFDVRDKTVILVDDVLTTGATIRECSRMLKLHGAGRVYSVVAGITPE